MPYKTRYTAVAPDVRDQDNATGRRPGYRFDIAENDGAILFQLQDAGEIDYSGDDASVNVSYKGIVMGYEEAEEVIEGLRAAIELARAKGPDSYSGRLRDKIVG